MCLKTPALKRQSPLFHILLYILVFIDIFKSTPLLKDSNKIKSRDKAGRIAGDFILVFCIDANTAEHCHSRLGICSFQCSTIDITCKLLGSNP